MKKLGLLGFACAAVVAASSFFAQRASAAIIYAVDTQNNLFNFDSNTPINIGTNAHFITGLGNGEQIISIDGRPATSQLFGMSNFSKLYTLDPNTGAATAVGSGFTPILNGNSFGFDFNPTVDRIRVVSDADQNVRLNPVTGGNAAVDTNLAYAVGDVNAGKNPSVVGAAYTNNTTNPTPTQTTLYDIDSVNNVLVTQGTLNGVESPNTGLLHTVGALGQDVTNLLGFDIGADGTAFAAMQTTTSPISSLYTINLNSGAATLVGPIIGGVQVRDIAVEPAGGFIVPEPGSILALGAMSLGMMMRRRTA